MNNPRLSLVTGTRNRPAGIARLIDSVIERTTVDYELLIADAWDVPMTCNHERVRVIHEWPRLGHCRGYNRLFRECDGEFVLWLNDDAEVCPGYDTAAIAFMEKHPTTGLGALSYSENGGPFRTNSAWQTVYANFGVIRKSVGDEVGWFDEELEMYGADNSLAFRVLMSDRGVNDIPAAKILHHSVNDHMRRENQIGRMRDNDTLTRKYMPHIRIWQAAYQRHFVPSGEIPWSHGRAPALVRA